MRRGHIGEVHAAVADTVHAVQQRIERSCKLCTALSFADALHVLCAHLIIETIDFGLLLLQLLHVKTGAVHDGIHSLIIHGKNSAGRIAEIAHGRLRVNIHGSHVIGHLAEQHGNPVNFIQNEQNSG